VCAEALHREGAFSTKWLKEQYEAINDESDKNRLLTTLKELSMSPASSRDIIRDFASATATAEGIKALGKLMDSAGNSAGLSVTICRIKAEASQSPEGMAALKHLNSTAARNTELAASFMKTMAAAAKSSEGLKHICTYSQAAGTAPDMAAADIALRNQAAKSPEGAINVVNFNVSLASNIESAAADLRIYSAASQCHEGINHITAYNNCAIRNQALSVSETRKYATAAQTSDGIRNISKYLYYVSKNSSASASEIGKSATAADSGTGLKELVNYNNWTSTDPMLASLELAKYASALNTAEGLSQIEHLNNSLSTSNEASTSEAAKYAMALQTPYGIKYLAELNNGLSRSAGASASEIRKRVAAVSNTDGGRHIETLCREIGKNKGTHNSETKMRAAAVLVPQGLEKFKAYSRFLKSSKTSESPMPSQPSRQSVASPAQAAISQQPEKVTVPAVVLSSAAQPHSEELTGREAAARTLAAMSLDMEPDAPVLPESMYSENTQEEAPSSGRDAALKTLEAINAVLGDDDDDEMYQPSSASRDDEDGVSVWKKPETDSALMAANQNAVQMNGDIESESQSHTQIDGIATQADKEAAQANQDTVNANLDAYQENQTSAQAIQKTAQANQDTVNANLDAFQENRISAQSMQKKTEADKEAVQAVSSQLEKETPDNDFELFAARANPLSPESTVISHSQQKEAAVSEPESVSEPLSASQEAPVSAVQSASYREPLNAAAAPLPYIEPESGDWLINDYIEVLNDHYEEWLYAIQEINPDTVKEPVKQEPAEGTAGGAKKHSVSEHKEYIIADTIQDDEKRLYSLLSKPLTEESLQHISVYVANSMTEEQKQLFLSILNQKITDEKRDMVMHLLVNPLGHEERRMFSLFLSKNPNPESRDLLRNALSLDFSKEQKQVLTNHLLKPAFQEQRKALNILISQNLTSGQKQWLISLFSRPLSEDMRQMIIRVLTHNISRENREVLLTIISQSFSGEARNFLISLISQPMSQEQRQLLFLLINRNLTAEQRQNLMALLAGKVSEDRAKQVILSFLGREYGGTGVHPGLMNTTPTDERAAGKGTTAAQGKQRLKASLSHINPDVDSSGFMLCSSLFPVNTYKKQEEISIISAKPLKREIPGVKKISVEPALLKSESVSLQKAGPAGKELGGKVSRALSDNTASRDEKLERSKSETQKENERREIYLQEPERAIAYKKAHEQPPLKAQLLDKKDETAPRRQLEERDFGEEYIKYQKEHEDSFKTFKMESRVYQFVSYICEDILKKRFGLHDFKKEYFTRYMCFLLRVSGDFTFSHSLRTQSLSLNLAKRAGIKDRTVLEQLRLGALFVDIGEMEFVFNDAPESKLDAVKGFLSDQDLLLAGVLHDIGKIKIPDSILYKPGKLTGEEFGVMRMHPIYSAMMLYPIYPLRHLCPVVRGHHEKWDGKGYPDGLEGENIPVAARIIAIADVFDALISDRPYKKGMPWPKVKKIMLEGRGTHFDPDLLDIFMDYVTPLYEA